MIDRQTVHAIAQSAVHFPIDRIRDRAHRAVAHRHPTPARVALPKFCMQPPKPGRVLQRRRGVGRIVRIVHSPAVDVVVVPLAPRLIVVALGQLIVVGIQIALADQIRVAQTVFDLGRLALAPAEDHSVVVVESAGLRIPIRLRHRIAGRQVGRPGVVGIAGVIAAVGRIVAAADHARRIDIVEARVTGIQSQSVPGGANERGDRSGDRGLPPRAVRIQTRVMHGLCFHVR